MANPFEKRATEYLRNDEAFLGIVTPEPAATFFEERAKEGRLFDRLTMIIGTPGSGKTTLARLFEFGTLKALLRNHSIANYRPLIDTLTTCGALRNGRPALIGGRLPLEAEYREFRELPYAEELQTGLMITLLQARTVLAWLRHIEKSHTSLDHVQIVPRTGADAALVAIGGTAGAKLQNRALEVEDAVYRVSAALVPPDIKDIGRAALDAYRPFDVIESFRVGNGAEVLELRPLAIFDDAHSLHQKQHLALRRWLTRREMRVARWILTRLDGLAPDDLFADSPNSTNKTGVNYNRESTVIWMQYDQGRATQRRQFRGMAKNMADRYLGRMDVFNRRGLRRLGDLLSTTPTPISPSNCGRLAEHVDRLQSDYYVSAKRRAAFARTVDRYLSRSQDNNEDLRLALMAILLERYAKRVPQHSLFEGDATGGGAIRPLTVDASVADGARIHLLHKYNRPYYFGIDTLCDASSENAEQFLHLAARLVSQSEVQVIRNRAPTLASSVQHRLLRERAGGMLRKWDFPKVDLVRKLADGIGKQCVSKSLEGNASLGGGATAIGIPQEEFDLIPRDRPELAGVLKFGVAYNAFALVPGHRTKNRLWCLIQLGGVLLLHHGLTLRRGGFLERGTADLVGLLREG